MSKPEAEIKSQKEKGIANEDKAPVLPNAATTSLQVSTKQSFMQLKTGTAKKLGKQAEGGINYRILGDTERKSIFVSITENEGGGYFSQEIVPFYKVEACITKREQEKPFPSKTFKEAFTGRSSNNAGFLAAILRTEGLLAAAPGTESQHVLSGDWAAWKRSSLSKDGTVIEIDAIRPAEKQLEENSIPERAEKRKTLTVKRAIAEASPGSAQPEDR